MDFRAIMRPLVLVGAMIWLAPGLVLAGGEEEADEQPAASPKQPAAPAANLRTRRTAVDYVSPCELQAATRTPLRR